MSRILVVEDSPTQAAEVCFLLEEAGFEASIAIDGMAAIASLRTGLPDLIVTDLQMPRLDGFELVEVVRSEYPTVPVVLITAHGSEDIAARALRRGAASYVPKRDLDRDLVGVVTEILALMAPNLDQLRILERLEEIRVQFTLENDRTIITPLICRVEEVLHHMRLCDRTDLTRVAVALREALLNAIDHGNLELDSELRQKDERIYEQVGKERCERSPYCERRVRFSVDVTHNEATFRIRDEGRGFDSSKLPDPNDPANFERIGGRGLLLIRTLMDEVTFNPTGNEILLVKRRRVSADFPQPEQLTNRRTDGPVLANKSEIKQLSIA